MKAPPKDLVVNLKPVIEHVRLMANRVQMMTNDLLTERRTFGSGFLDGDNADRDLDEECGYPQPLTLEHLYAMKERELGDRVCGVVADETWATEPEVYETEDASKTPFETRWDQLVFDLDVWHYMARVDALSGIGHYGVLFIGFNDGNDPKTPVAGIDKRGNPIPEDIDPDLDVLLLRALDERRARIVETEKNKKSPRFGLPTYYDLHFGMPTSTDMTPGEFGATNPSSGAFSLPDAQWVRVHWTRVLHIADNLEASEVYGVPRQKPVYNRLHDLRKILGGSGEMFYRGAFPGISFEMLPELVAEADVDSELMQSLKEQVELYMQGIRRYLALRGMTAKSLAPQVADPSKHVEEQLRLLCATIKVPMRVFLGTEAGQLASDQDIKTWNKRIGKRKRTYVNPRMIKPFVNRLMMVGILPTVKSFSIAWSDPETVSDKDQADIVMKKATALLNYVTSGAETVFPVREFLMLVFGLTPEQTDSVMRAADKAGKKYVTPGAKAPVEPPTGSGPKDPSKKTGKAAPNAQAKRVKQPA